MEMGWWHVSHQHGGLLWHNKRRGWHDGWSIVCYLINGSIRSISIWIDLDIEYKTEWFSLLLPPQHQLQLPVFRKMVIGKIFFDWRGVFDLFTKIMTMKLIVDKKEDDDRNDFEPQPAPLHLQAAQLLRLPCLGSCLLPSTGPKRREYHWLGWGGRESSTWFIIYDFLPTIDWAWYKVSFNFCLNISNCSNFYGFSIIFESV